MTMPIDRQAEVMRLFHAKRWKIGCSETGVRLPSPRPPSFFPDPGMLRKFARDASSYEEGWRAAEDHHGI